MDVKPWEPIMGGHTDFDIWPWNEDEYQCRDVISGYCRRVNVTLANNQRIIVRALSEDRKAARSAMKEANQ